LAHFFAAARMLRLADGPDEVHMSQLGKNVIKRYTQGWKVRGARFEKIKVTIPLLIQGDATRVVGELKLLQKGRGGWPRNMWGQTVNTWVLPPLSPPLADSFPSLKKEGGKRLKL